MCQLIILAMTEHTDLTNATAQQYIDNICFEQPTLTCTITKTGKTFDNFPRYLI